jgi:hypothetical protein
VTGLDPAQIAPAAVDITPAWRAYVTACEALTCVHEGAPRARAATIRSLYGWHPTDTVSGKARRYRRRIARAARIR